MADPPWNDNTKITDYTSHQPSLRKILHNMSCVGENHEKNGLLCIDLLIWHIRQSFASESRNVWSGLKTKWLRNPLSGNSLRVSFISPNVLSCFTYCFSTFFRYFPCFLWCFSIFPILGLTLWKPSGTEIFHSHSFPYFNIVWIEKNHKKGEK